ncbi:2-oxoglutarate-dependent dioxygenase AOP1.2 [Spatholobus suberectus]|nr:2-oxoglutarate-dependent dioxygenase AOP1.2 [Spatholobus suberectus]
MQPLELSKVWKGSEATLKLLVIDFTNFKLEANNPNWEVVKSQVHKALVEYDCFEATFDEVPLDICKAIFPILQELFDLPLQTKILNVSKTHLSWLYWATSCGPTL